MTAFTVPEPRTVLDRTLKDGRRFLVVLDWNGNIDCTLEGKPVPYPSKLPKPVTMPSGKVCSHASGQVAIPDEEMAVIEAARKEWRQSPLGRRAHLQQQVVANYSDTAFPGSSRWAAHKAAQDRLDAYDREHPEVKAALDGKIREIAQEGLALLGQ